MKLWYSPPSPYVRKVLMLAHETGLIEQIELRKVTTTVLDPDGDLAKTNPLNKIPTLELDDGHVLFDSRVISEYLDGLHNGPKMLPAEGMDRYNVLVCQAMGDGIMDVAVPIRYEQALRPQEYQWDVWLNAQQKKIVQTLDVLETWRHGRLQDIHVGSISVASALAYLDFRQPDFDWRDGRPVLTQMLATFSERESMKQTSSE